MGKSSKINKEKVVRRLNEMGMQQKELAYSVGVSPEALNRALKRGTIDSIVLDRIGFNLDLAPEYLEDNPSMIDGFPNNYNVHETQKTENQWTSIIRAIWVREGLDPRYLDKNTFFGLLPVIENAANEYIKALPPEVRQNAEIKKDRLVREKIRDEKEFREVTSIE